MHSKCVCVCVLCNAHGLCCVLSMFYTSVVHTGMHDHCFSLNTVVHMAGYENSQAQNMGYYYHCIFIFIFFLFKGESSGCWHTGGHR